MNFIHHKFFLILILYSSLYFIISEKITFSKYQTAFEIPNSNQKFGEFEVKGDDTPKFFLSAYSDASKDNRIQLGQGYNGYLHFILSTKDFSQKIYLEIECQKSNSCNGEINYFFVNEIELKEGKPISYYVHKDNEELDFKIELNSNKNNIWATGQYSMDSTLEPNNSQNIKKTINNYGDFYIIKEGKSFTFKVKPKKGDFVNVGFFGYQNSGDSNQNIELSGPALIGYLKKKDFDQICYTFDTNQLSENSLILGNGIIFTKIGYSYSAFDDGEEYAGTLFSCGLIKNGLMILDDDEKRPSKMCFKFPDSTLTQYKNVDEFVFMYQLELSQNETANFYDPQFNGVMYSRTVGLGGKSVFVSQNKPNFEKMSLNLKSVIGFPKMYVFKCENYPFCNYDKSELNKATRPRDINRFSSLYSKKEDGFDDSPISKKQTVFVVVCEEGQERKDKENLPGYMNFICDYTDLIYKDENIIELEDENFFNQFVLKDEKHNYKIKIAGESGVKKIFIDLMIYVGDVKVDITGLQKDKLKADLYYQANKIFISVKINENSENIKDDLYFSVIGNNNTYYTTLVTFANKETEVDSFITNKLQSGMSYLVTIDSSVYDETGYKNKIIIFKNERAFDLIPYMVTFYSLNCEIETYKRYDNQETELEKYEKFYQDVVSPLDEERYLFSEYEYRIKIKSPDLSQYSGSLCKIYASAIELSLGHEGQFSRDILVPDNIPQQIRFEKNVKHVSFGYIHVDFNYDLLVKFNPKHAAKYRVKIYYENYERKEEVTVVSNNVLILPKSEWNETACKDSTRVCYITLDITREIENEQEENYYPVLEFSIKSINTYSVAYVPKNQLKIDYVRDNAPQYYYTEIGSNENGFIMVNFLRGSGKVYARIVHDKEEPEENAVWRGKYRLPTDGEEIEFEPFTETLHYYTYDDCQYGCFLLLSVFSDVKGFEFLNRYYTYSLIVRSSPDNVDYLVSPIISIPLDQYIVGSVEPSSQENRMFSFYSVLLNYDADEVVIDFQSDVAGIFINVGDIKPVIGNADFEHWSKGFDSVYRIPKEKIMEKVQTMSQKEKGLRDIVLTIGVATNLIDSIFTTPFSFAVRLVIKEIEIYRVNSDEKVLCQPKTTYFSDNYRCVYVIDYNFVHLFSAFFIYANVQDKSAKFDIYANYISAVDYEIKKDPEELNSLIPNENSNAFSTKKDKSDYLFIPEGTNREEYLLVSVETDKNTIIEFLTSLMIFQQEISPNPSSPQLFSAMGGQEFYITLPEKYQVIVNIECIGGEGEFSWDFAPENTYKLKGRDDRLSITSNPSNNPHKLKVKDLSSESINNPLVFILDYNIRVDYINFDALNLEKSINYVYVDSDFPITYYSPLDKFNDKLDNSNSYYDIFFTFDILETKEEKKNTYYENHPFVVHGFIVRQSLVYEARLNRQLAPKVDENTIFGFYDQAVRTGLIRITQENIKKWQEQEIEKPYLYLEIDKEEGFKNIRSYKRVSLGTSVSYSNSEIPLSEMANQFGYLDINQNEINYYLRNNKNNTYMFLEFSSVDDNLAISLGNQDLDKKTEKYESYGKTIYYFDTKNLGNSAKFTVKRKDTQNEKTLQYFLFRYYFEDTFDKDKYKYKLANNNVSVKQLKYDDGKSDFTIKLSPLEIQDSKAKEYNVTYILRLVDEEKSMPKKANIAIKPVKQIIKEFYDPVLNNGEKELTFQIYDVNAKDIKYVEVILQVRHEELLEYLSYNIAKDINIENTKRKQNKSNDNNTPIIVCSIIGGFLLIIVIVLIVVIIIFNNKNKDLLDKVNKVSFADNEKRGEDDLLLSKD